jgi:hypothetical protein
MTPEFWAIIAVGAGVLGSHVALHRDIASLRERNVLHVVLRDELLDRLWGQSPATS